MSAKVSLVKGFEAINMFVVSMMVVIQCIYLLCPYFRYCQYFYRIAQFSNRHKQYERYQR